MCSTLRDKEVSCLQNRHRMRTGVLRLKGIVTQGEKRPTATSISATISCDADHAVELGFLAAAL
jgi:hypothetical protein